MDAREKWSRWVLNFGTFSNLLMLVAILSFPVGTSLLTGVWPNFEQLMPAFLAVVIFILPWAPGETIGFMPVMGPGPLYMSYVTGNITNLKLPATVGTIK